MNQYPDKLNDRERHHKLEPFCRWEYALRIMPAEYSSHSNDEYGCESGQCNSVDTVQSQDITAVQQLLTGSTADFEKRSFKVEPSFFTKNTFLLSSVNTKVFVLLLAQAKPKSFFSSADVNLDNVLVTCNRTEFHHIFPKNYLLTVEGITDRSQQFMLANFAFLSQTDNRSIKDKAPAEYVKMIAPGSKESVLESAIIPKGGLEMSYKDFIDARSRLLASNANELLAVDTTTPKSVA